jgi:hypothetical protein
LVRHTSLVFSQSPVDQIADPGQSVIMQAHVIGGQPTALRWQKDGQDITDGGSISGATTETLQIQPVALRDAGEYRLRASDACGAVTSESAVLEVIPACQSDIAPPGGNGAVDIDDLVDVIIHWGSCRGCAADVFPAGGNGEVNIDDLVAVITAWGPCP